MMKKKLRRNNPTPRWKNAPGKAPGIIKIESTDRAIDRLVYELHGLTEEEIKIVEG